MQLKFKKSYKFALKSSVYVTLFFLATIFLYHYFVQPLNLLVVLAFSLIFYAATFFLIQFRVEHFIYKRVKKIYDDVSLLETTSYVNQPVTTDMATLTKEVKKFARDKKLEIETLKIREEYRKEFLGNVSHELKTPLFTIQGYLLTLLDGAMEDKNIRTKYLERAEKGVERLIYIVKDLDMITKLEVGEINLDVTKFDIVEVVQNVFDLFEMKAANKNITLTFDTKYAKPIWVMADQEKIQQVVTNLVVNSIKYGKKGGTTEVGIEDLTKDKFIVRITDNGEGIE